MLGLKRFVPCHQNPVLSSDFIKSGFFLSYCMDTNEYYARIYTSQFTC